MSGLVQVLIGVALIVGFAAALRRQDQINDEAYAKRERLANDDVPGEGA